jgi:hypothetical protein
MYPNGRPLEEEYGREEEISQAVKFLICILEMPGSNFGRGTFSFDLEFHVFLHSFDANTGRVPQNLGYDLYLPHTFQVIIYYHSIT